MATPATCSFRLLDLPFEIRDKIYREITVLKCLRVRICYPKNLETYHLSYATPSKACDAAFRDRSAMLRTCRQIHAEIVQMPKTYATDLFIHMASALCFDDNLRWERVVHRIHKDITTLHLSLEGGHEHPARISTNSPLLQASSMPVFKSIEALLDTRSGAWADPESQRRLHNSADELLQRNLARLHKFEAILRLKFVMPTTSRVQVIVLARIKEPRGYAVAHIQDGTTSARRIVTKDLLRADLEHRPFAGIWRLLE